MLTHPRLSVLLTNDQQATLDFLTQALGFRLDVDVPYGSERRWIEVCLPGSPTSVVLAQVDVDTLGKIRDQAGRMTHGWFNCDNLEATCEKLRNEGVEILEEPQATSWRQGNQWAQIAGWDGNTYGLIETTT
ncbi:hypothetical protein GCM10007079_02050 [Nocardiopsis terrae]|uniref:Catechol 2,3-dioxygenase-like lactoylglutathione lyase family enzyme n=1 Tax=Nocardiopsis terrae TaxID=372655 RepID=A0ABR9HMS4_9ACTN|nr:VOC family protein [Nocardiopsis terrae]MBE1460258.1 catechol 2,3-dioxygenase-like lactoylglutathione lyase family enzyme [Nocardiopsis terrae]GHC70510.1 hypothetical protein GCM10007079_02050 [Nocardiopsis terrae]